MSRRTRLALDIGMFVAFLVALAPRATGISVHEWLSLALILPALLHIVINWDWVLHVSARLFARVRAASRLNLSVDALLFGATVTVMLSGLMVSQAIAATLGLHATTGGVWGAVHSISARAAVMLMAAHLGLHAGWVAQTLRGRARQTAEVGA